VVTTTLAVAIGAAAVAGIVAAVNKPKW
jgi:hypothetical protein